LRRWFGTSVGALTATCLSLVASLGRCDTDAALARRLLAAGEILPLETFIERARRIQPGILIDADLRYESEHQGHVYEIHMLTPDGRVWEVELDAATGELLETEGADD